MDCKVRKGTIHYKVLGNGFPFLILHAMGTDHGSMKAWIEHFLTNLLDNFPNSTFAVLDMAGHMLQIEKRDAVQALLKDWVTSSD